MFASLPKSFSIKKSAVLLAISEEVVTKAREMLQHALQREWSSSDLDCRKKTI